MARPLLFLDVDGVLNLWGDEREPTTQVRFGYQTLRHASALPQRLARLNAAFTRRVGDHVGRRRQSRPRASVPTRSVRRRPLRSRRDGPGRDVQVAGRFAGWRATSHARGSTTTCSSTTTVLGADARRPDAVLQADPAIGLGEYECRQLIAFAAAVDAGSVSADSR